MTWATADMQPACRSRAVAQVVSQAATAGRRFFERPAWSPRGYWTAYGEIGAAATGSRRAARLVARLATNDPAFPNAWRVIHADGTIPEGWGRSAGGPARCRSLLEAEGVAFRNARADPAKKILAEEIELLLAGE
jgi:alkylated DNA nucleotide flippase Atl1